MKTKRIISVAFLAVLFFAVQNIAQACSSASMNVANAELHTAEIKETSNAINIAQQLPRFGETPEDSVICVRNLSLYAEYYNQRNFQLAYEPWRKALEVCPQSSQNIFIRGIVLVKMKYNEETDPIKRDAWVDTLMMVHDKRIKYFGREGFVLGRKATDMFQYRPNNIQEIYETSKKSIELEGNESQANVLVIYMQALIRLVEAGLLEEEEVLLAYDQIMEIIDYNLEHNPDDKQFFEPAKANIESMFEPFATCENIITLFQPRFEQNPNNIELLEKITSMLDNSGCTEEALFYKATRNLHKLKPTAQSAFLMGRLENNAQNYREAINYFEQAVELYESDSEKFTALLLMAEISFRQLRQYPQARSYALQASSIDPENGRPYLLIGEMYAASASACGDDELTRSVAYWAAVDKFIQARNVDNDPVVQERAKQLIDVFSQHFPNREVTFFHGLDDGDTYRVGCWINETTRVRSRQ